MTCTTVTRTSRPRWQHRCSPALLLLLASVTAHATTYRWVDANGVVHYSDRPQPGAAKVDLPQAQTYTQSPAASAPAETPAAAPIVVMPPPAAAMMPLSGCVITAPTREQTFVNAQSVSVIAKGPAGGEARLLLDGGLRQKSTTGEFLVTPIARGSHTAVVIFMTVGGGQVCRTESVTFFVRQPSILRKPPQKR